LEARRNSFRKPATWRPISGISWDRKDQRQKNRKIISPEKPKFMLYHNAGRAIRATGRVEADKKFYKEARRFPPALAGLTMTTVSAGYANPELLWPLATAGYARRGRARRRPTQRAENATVIRSRKLI